uniref:PH domain-containing protein n=1 Tax=Apteryx owenii TaxID=8824 RepID=A0A8B9P2F2_APTOW
WIKKSSGGLLGLWKDRYIQLRKTQLVVYEDEDEQKCIETVELESYDKCQELRALLKKKNRFILIRSPGKKVHDIKFQAPTLEEKESWIKALNEGINRGKNKIFDEVKVDESLSLDHVTRDRVKMTQGRRPPTRSHLKEVNSTSDGILRLDLDIVDNGPPNLDSTISESDNPPPQKETPKPPMPPTKPTASKDSVNVTEEDSVSREENAEGSRAPSEENRETLTEVSNKGITKAPIPLPKNVPDKLKVTWDQPVPEPKTTEDLKSSEDGSKENLVEIATADDTKPLVPPKVLSEKFLATINASQGDLEAEGLEDLESHSSNPPVNGIEDSEVAVSTSPKSVKVTIEKKTSGESPSALRLRSSSLGDLLFDSKTTQREKVANEREKTEKLLQKVLRGGLEQAQEGNGPPVMAETLLNEAVEQLRQATQVLQEIKDFGELKKESTEKQKGKQKDLVTLYRRSAP